MVKSMVVIVSAFVFIFCLGLPLAEARSLRTAEADDLLELTGVRGNRVSEVELYQQIVERFRAEDEIGLVSRVQTMLRQFPLSAHADNALYLLGKHYYQQKDFPRSIRYLNQLERDYPNSNKLVSAKFIKAMTFRRMNLDEQAQGVFQDLVRRYPGSPEAYRAMNELRVRR